VSQPMSEPAKDAAPAAEAPAKSEAAPVAAAAATKFRLRPIPIFMVVLLGLGIPVLASLLIDFAGDHMRLPAVHTSRLSFLYYHHGVQLVLSLIAIAIARRVVPANYGLQWPRGNGYIVPAIYWGLAFGLIMTLVDYGPNLLAHTAPKFDDPLTRPNVIGWLFFQGAYSGPTEEVLYRALLVTYLAATMPGKVHFRGFEMNGAGVVVAVIFALAHMGSFITEFWLVALGQQVYAFALGVLYAYWFEKSKSIVAPIVGHNLSNLTEYILLFAMIATWR